MDYIILNQINLLRQTICVDIQNFASIQLTAETCLITGNMTNDRSNDAIYKLKLIGKAIKKEVGTFRFARLLASTYFFPAASPLRFFWL